MYSIYNNDFINKYIKNNIFIRCSTQNAFEDCINILKNFKNFININEPINNFYKNNTCICIMYKNGYTDKLVAIPCNVEYLTETQKKENLYSIKTFKSDFNKFQKKIWN